MQFSGTNGRLVIFILFTAFLFLFTSYSASIVVLLQSTSSEIRNLEDLLNSKLELGVEDIAYNKYHFMSATEPIRKAIYEKKVAPPGTKPKFMPIDEGVQKLQKNPFAFHMNVGSGYRVVEKYFLEHEKCGLQEIAFILPFKTWLSCKRNSSFKEIFTIGMYRLREHGLTYREQSIFFSRKPTCSVHGGSFASVNIMDVYPVVLLLSYGMLLAFALLAVEILVHQRKALQQRRSS